MTTAAFGEMTVTASTPRIRGLTVSAGHELQLFDNSGTMRLWDAGKRE